MDAKVSDVYIITAPSGTGKTTLNRRLTQEVPGLEISVSLTTRPQRTGERDGDHYWFVDKPRFFAAVDGGRMLEWAEVFGNYYGTSLDEIQRIRALGRKTILEIDVQGWQQAKTKVPEAASIFILPPSIRALWERLQKRGTDSLANRWRRISTARAELNHCAEFKHFIINDQLEEAFAELKQVVSTGHSDTAARERGLEHSQRLIAEFDGADWLQAIRQQLGQN